MTIDLATLLTLAQYVGAVGFLLTAFALIGVQRKWWVPYWVYEQEQARSAKWEQLAINGTLRLRDAVEVAES